VPAHCAAWDGRDAFLEGVGEVANARAHVIEDLVVSLESGFFVGVPGQEDDEGPVSWVGGGAVVD